MQILYQDDRIVVCVKPAGIRSTDEPGGMPDLLRQALGDPVAAIRTVHRLDQVVSGVMVFARTKRAAADLSEQIRNHHFHKEYLAVLRGCPPHPAGTLTDLLARSSSQRRTYVVQEPGPDVQQAVLDYRVEGQYDDLSLVRIRLHTGRTHQIRVQFSSRNMPLVGDRKYGPEEKADCDIALWSHRLRFAHPRSGELLDFTLPPPAQFPWTYF